MRRLPTLAGLLVVVGVLLGLAGSAQAAPGAPAQSGGDAGRVSIIKVEGLVDPVMADFIEKSIRDGEKAQVIAVVLQLDSSGSVVSDARLVDLARTIHDASVPVAVWVGPSGSRARRRRAARRGRQAGRRRPPHRPRPRRPPRQDRAAGGPRRPALLGLPGGPRPAP
ncbi:hypothetical protein KSP35_17095 [Aquihabitans sp. G128]|uniref:hypothetical protein n=1 Tax=Aquihabitans sp. G128 TaxID=2849779 RepID=UPI001C222EAE|nr:hypothetical protein [Aquihabitans sp. G128]QXC60064.1 hypothetical protein KSP35_17095 [Aquihabitans sp. G128]